MKYKILIVDDEEMILAMMRQCLGEEFLVYTADSAKRRWNCCTSCRI